MTPVTTPVAYTTGAIGTALLLHTPPAGEAFNVVDTSIQIVVVPVIAEGMGLTVTLTVVMVESWPFDICMIKASVPVKPVAGVYVKPDGVTILPVDTPVALKPPKVPCSGALLTTQCSVKP